MEEYYEQTANAASAIEFCPNCGTPLGMTDSATQPDIDFYVPCDVIEELSEETVLAAMTEHDLVVKMPPVSQRDAIVIVPERLARLEAVADVARAVSEVANRKPQQEDWSIVNWHLFELLAEALDGLDKEK